MSGGVGWLCIPLSASSLLKCISFPTFYRSSTTLVDYTFQIVFEYVTLCVNRYTSIASQNYAKRETYVPVPAITGGREEAVTKYTTGPATGLSYGPQRQLRVSKIGACRKQAVMMSSCFEKKRWKERNILMC